MASLIPQTFSPSGQSFLRVSLDRHLVAISCLKGIEWNWRTYENQTHKETDEDHLLRLLDSSDEQVAVIFFPQTRSEANEMAISLRLAAKRLEEIGKGLE